MGMIIVEDAFLILVQVDSLLFLLFVVASLLHEKLIGGIFFLIDRVLHDHREEIVISSYDGAGRRYLYRLLKLLLGRVSCPTFRGLLAGLGFLDDCASHLLTLLVLVFVLTTHLVQRAVLTSTADPRQDFALLLAAMVMVLSVVLVANGAQADRLLGDHHLVEADLGKL